MSPDGQFLFFNQTFETMLKVRLGLKSVPTSIYKLTSDHEESHQKVKGLIQDMIKPSSSFIGSDYKGSFVMKNSESSFSGSPKGHHQPGPSQRKVEVRLAKQTTQADVRSGGLLKED